jgi:hypothetical protein
VNSHESSCLCLKCKKLLARCLKVRLPGVYCKAIVALRVPHLALTSTYSSGCYRYCRRNPVPRDPPIYHIVERGWGLRQPQPTTAVGMFLIVGGSKGAAGTCGATKCARSRPTMQEGSAGAPLACTWANSRVRQHASRVIVADPKLTFPCCISILRSNGFPLLLLTSAQTSLTSAFVWSWPTSPLVTRAPPRNGMSARHQ